MYVRDKSILLGICVMTMALLLPESSLAQTAPELIEPALQVDIPGLNFSEAEFDGDILRANYISDYIAAMYRFLLGAGTTIAIVFIMISGLMWAISPAGGKESVEKAKKRMKNSVVGLVLLMSTYAILFLVNPNLTLLRVPGIELVDLEPLVRDSGDQAGALSQEDLINALSEVGVDCAGAGESGDIAEIAQQLEGKVTYRFGAKGNGPDYPGEGRRKSSNQFTATFCPEGTICFDCSGYVHAVAQCAGATDLNEAQGTQGIFTGADQLTACDETGTVSTDTESFDLVEGDLIGFKPGDFTQMRNFGHVWMYIGNGRVISAVGGDSGRVAGQSVNVQSLTGVCSNYPVRVVQRDI